MANDVEAEVARKSAEVLQKTRADSRLSHYVSTDKIPSVFMETDDVRDVRLIVMEQAPTVKNKASREIIETVLNLDKPRGSLYKYISNLRGTWATPSPACICYKPCKELFHPSTHPNQGVQSSG